MNQINMPKNENNGEFDVSKLYKYLRLANILAHLGKIDLGELDLRKNNGDRVKVYLQFMPVQLDVTSSEYVKRVPVNGPSLSSLSVASLGEGDFDYEMLQLQKEDNSKYESLKDALNQLGAIKGELDPVFEIYNISIGIVREQLVSGPSRQGYRGPGMENVIFTIDKDHNLLIAITDLFPNLSECIIWNDLSELNSANSQ